MSWRTSLAGLLVVVAQLVSLLPSLPPWLSTVLHVLGAIAGGAGLVLARDHAVPVPLPCEPVERVRLPVVRDAVAQVLEDAAKEAGKGPTS